MHRNPDFWHLQIAVKSLALFPTRRIGHLEATVWNGTQQATVLIPQVFHPISKGAGSSCVKQRSFLHMEVLEIHRSGRSIYTTHRPLRYSPLIFVNLNIVPDNHIICLLTTLWFPTMTRLSNKYSCYNMDYRFPIYRLPTLSPSLSHSLSLYTSLSHSPSLSLHLSPSPSLYISLPLHLSLFPGP